MRYYDIALSDPTTGKPIIPNSLTGLNYTSITSLYPGGGGTNPAALDIELDINQLPTKFADTASYVRIYGLGLKDIGTAFNLGVRSTAQSVPDGGAFGANITVRAGMAPGLPLASAAAGQQGVIAQGRVFQAFGNWLGTDMTVDIYFMPVMGTQGAPSNFAFNWPAGTQLSQAIANTLSKAMPSFSTNIQIQQRTLPHGEQGFYKDLPSFAGFVKGITGPASPIQMSISGTTVNVWDGTKPPSSVKKIRYQDLIGQVTWAAPFQVTAKLVMRGDLNVLDVVQFPPGIARTTGAALLKLSDASTFQGKFQIVHIQHWGRYRQPDAMSWNTTIWCNDLSSASQAPQSADATGSSFTGG